VCLVLGIYGCVTPRASSTASEVASQWRPAKGNPIIKMGDAVEFMLWNDPTVLKEGDTYRMWLSGGDPRNLQRIVVNVHHATSADGVRWIIQPSPVLAPSDDPRAWDSLRIETPSVVKVGDTYHMYYSGCDEARCREGIYAIGHATSRDGLTWTKDRSNPVLSAQSSDRFKWGYRGVGEPGVLYNAADKTFYLYYTSMRFSPKEPTIGNIGILLAKSTDGSAFTPVVDGAGAAKLVLTRDIPNATKGAWFGYTTPAPVQLTSGEVHLFCSFIVAPKGPATARHVTLVDAVSRDFENFQVLNENVFEAGTGSWIDHQVRSPTVIVDGGRLEMWFAGETHRPHFGAGIGHASVEQSALASP
jgi:hypothetical protein